MKEMGLLHLSDQIKYVIIQYYIVHFSIENTVTKKENPNNNRVILS